MTQINYNCQNPWETGEGSSVWDTGENVNSDVWDRGDEGENEGSHEIDDGEDDE